MVWRWKCWIAVSKLVSLNFDCAIMFTFELSKRMNPFIPQLWVKYYHYCSSTRMLLALDHSQKLICHQTKKPHTHTHIYIYIYIFNGLHSLSKTTLEKSEWPFYFGLNNQRYRIKSMDNSKLILIELLCSCLVLVSFFFVGCIEKKKKKKSVGSFGLWLNCYC